MNASPVNIKDVSVEHIGSAPHKLRNALIAVSLVGIVGFLILFYWHSGKEANDATAELTHFRQTMFHRCGGTQFDGATNPQLADLYADSSRMRAVVVKQFHMLQRENTDCTEVIKALRSVDYPIR